MTASVIASILVLSLVATSPLQRGLASDRIDESDDNHDFNDSLPQPNDKSVVLEAEASNALFEPAAGLSNVFGPGGLFPFEGVFDCADALTCGVSAILADRFRVQFLPYLEKRRLLSLHCTVKVEQPVVRRNR